MHGHANAGIAEAVQQDDTRSVRLPRCEEPAVEYEPSAAATLADSQVDADPRAMASASCPSVRGLATMCNGP